MKEQILYRFNKGAETYHDAAKIQHRVANKLARRLPLAQPKSILEIGSGTGLFSNQLLAKYPQASLLLADIAPAMIDVCKRRFSHHSRIQFSCIDGEKLPSSVQFDMIASSMTLHWFTEYKNSFSNIIDRLATGGCFVFAMLGENSLREWKHIYKTRELPIPTPLLPCQYQLQRVFPGIKIETEILSQPYQNSYEFLRSLKKTGATTTRRNYRCISPGKLRRLLREFDEEIHISYEIIYGVYIKNG